MQDTSKTTVKKGRRWGRVLLGVSLAFNVLILGAIAGHRIGDDNAPRRTHYKRDISDYGPYTRALSGEDRAAIRESLRAQSDDFRTRRKEVRAGFKAFVAALRAQPYEPDETRELLEQQRRQVGENVGRVQDLLLDRIDAMSDEERAAFADRLVQELRRGPRHSGG